MLKADRAEVEEIARRIAREEIRAFVNTPEPEATMVDAVIVEPTTGTSVTNFDIDSVTMTNDLETVTGTEKIT